MVQTHTHTFTIKITIIHACINNRVIKKINVPSKRESSKVRTKLNRSTKHVLVTSRKLYFRNYVFKILINSCAVRVNLTFTLQYQYYGTVCVVIHERTVCRGSILVRRTDCISRAFLLSSSFPTYLCIFFNLNFFLKRLP